MKKNTELTLNEWAKAKISTTAKIKMQKLAKNTKQSESAIVRDAITFYFKHLGMVRVVETPEATTPYRSKKPASKRQHKQDRKMVRQHGTTKAA